MVRANKITGNSVANGEFFIGFLCLSIFGLFLQNFLPLIFFVHFCRVVFEGGSNFSRSFHHAETIILGNSDSESDAYLIFSNQVFV